MGIPCLSHSTGSYVQTDPNYDKQKGSYPSEGTHEYRCHRFPPYSLDNKCQRYSLIVLHLTNAFAIAAQRFPLLLQRSLILHKIIPEAIVLHHKKLPDHQTRSVPAELFYAILPLMP